MFDDPLVQQNLTQIITVAPIAMLVVWLMSRLFFLSSGISFSRDVWPEIKKDPRAVADYAGRRFLALCLLAGFVVFKSV